MIYIVSVKCCFGKPVNQKTSRSTATDHFSVEKSSLTPVFPVHLYSFDLHQTFVFQCECNPETCSQMTATEQWIFLCAAHKTPKEVCDL